MFKATAESLVLSPWILKPQLWTHPGRGCGGCELSVRYRFPRGVPDLSGQDVLDPTGLAVGVRLDGAGNCSGLG